MHRDQKGYDYFMACGFKESFDKSGLFNPHLKLTFSNFLFEKQIGIEKTCSRGTNPYFSMACFKSNLDIAAVLKR